MSARDQTSQNLARLTVLGAPPWVHRLCDRHLEGLVSRITHVQNLRATDLETQLADTDVLVLGLEEPGREQLHLCQTLQQEPMPPVVIGVLSRENPYLAAKALDAGVLRVLVRPFEAVELQAMVRAALRRRREQAVPGEDGLDELLPAELFERQLAGEVAAFQRHGRPFALMLAQLTNDPTADSSSSAKSRADLLRTLGRSLRSGLRPYDTVSLRQEQIAVLLSHAPARPAKRVFGRLLCGIDGRKPPGEPAGYPMAFAAGVVVAPPEPGQELSARDVLTDAERALREARDSPQGSIVVRLSGMDTVSAAAALVDGDTFWFEQPAQGAAPP